MTSWLAAEIGHGVIDPVLESENLKRRMRKRGARLTGVGRRGGDWTRFFRSVVDADTRLVLRRADYIICLWNTSARRGAGTQGELTLARSRGIPVYVVSRTPLDQMPGWIQGCTTRRFGGWTALKRFLLTHQTSFCRIDD